MRQPLARIALVTTVLIGAGVALPSAYVLNGPKWATRTVNYYVNPSNLDVSAEAAEAAVQAGAAVWGSQSAADFRFYYMGRTTGTSLTNNGKNEVFFRNAASGGLIAETYWWADANAHLIDADIVFYDGGFTFFTGGTGCNGGIYVENTAAHEFGHALGMGHSADPDATMYAVSSYCSTSGLTLNADDLSGVEALYPPASANTAPGLTITAPSSGTSIAAGAMVTLSATASDQQDGILSGSIVWRSSLAGSLGVGSSLAALLPTGVQTLTASVTDSAGATTTASVGVTVAAAAAPAPMTLSAVLTSTKSGPRVDLRWSGAAGANVDVYRNGGKLTATANDGSYSDSLGKRAAAGSYLYTVCASGTKTCAPGVAVVY
jgi:hypothetical protein